MTVPRQFDVHRRCSRIRLTSVVSAADPAAVSLRFDRSQLPWTESPYALLILLDKNIYMSSAVIFSLHLCSRNDFNAMIGEPGSPSA